MNQKLFFVLFMLTFFGYSQTPISNYDSAPASSYAIVTSSPAIDQSATGFLTWTFNNLSATGTSSDAHTVPTGGEQATYPGTTSVATTTRGSEISKVFTKNASGAVSITGADVQGLLLNYNTDNALIGTFPLSYGYTNTDNNVSGTYNYDTYSGSFSGSIMASVDGYGTLIMNDLGFGAFNGNVTRLKTYQTISLDYSIFSGIGTATQTSYNYYDANNGNLVFRTTTATITVSLLSINETVTVMESLLSSTLDVNNHDLPEQSVSVSPNPVKDNLNLIFNNNDAVIRSITISDINGRRILKNNTNGKTFSVNQLKSGIYIVSITTDKGTLSRKFVKQ